LSSYPAAVSNAQVANDANLSGQNNSISDFAAPGDAHLGYDNGFLAHVNIVSDLNLVIDFRSSTDAGLAQGRPIHGGVGPDFHIVLNNHSADLGDFKHIITALSETEPITAQDYTGMQNHPVAEDTSGHNGAVGGNDAILPDTAAFTDIRPAGYSTPRADNSIRTDEGEGVDRSLVRNPGLVMNKGQTAVSMPAALRSGKKLHNTGKIVIWILTHIDIVPPGGLIRGQDNSPGQGFVQQLAVFGVGQKAYLVLLGLFQGITPCYFDVPALVGQVQVPGYALCSPGHDVQVLSFYFSRPYSVLQSPVW
jgi:hypothetical protein